VLIFGIAFGLSMDYTVFLLSRIKEQYDATGDTLSSIREGIQKTGTIITSAALLFIVVVSAFATSTIPLIKQIGVGLGLAIFFDAFVIRMLLVPAIMRVFNRQNWWAPKLLRRPRGV
jgi:trehalose monomycolate/heme transporter